MKKQLSYLYLSIRDLVAPLEESLASLEGLEYLFHKYGWEIELDEEVYGKIRQALVLREPLEKFVESADLIMNRPPEEEMDLSDLAIVIERGKILFQSIANFEAGNLSDFEGPLKEPDFWEDIAAHIFDDLLVNYIHGHKPVAYALLQFFGVIRFEYNNAQEGFKTAYTQTIFDWDQLIKSVRNPLEAFNDFYHWNKNNESFDHPRLLHNIQSSLESLQIQSVVIVPSADFLGNTEFNPSQAYNIEEEVMELYIPFQYGMRLTDRAVLELGLSAIPIPKNGTAPPSGFLVRPISRGSASQEIQLNENFKLEWKVAADASNLLQLIIFPDNTSLDSGEIVGGAALGFHSTFTDPLYIFGNENTTHVKLEQLSFEVKILGSATDPELQLVFRINGNPGLKASVIFDESDNFLKETVARSTMEAGFSPEIIWSTKSGITFNGSISLDTTIGLHKEVAGIKFETLFFSLGQGKSNASTNNASLNLGLALSGSLGPVIFKVEKIGFSLDLLRLTREQLKEQAFEEPSLVFGALGLDLNYLPPKGIGIQVKSEFITGGGFLELDPANHRYAGVLVLKLALEKRDLGLVAVGLVDTRLPNGEKGFSMLISISVYFSPAIQLAFGFKLNAVGGLAGIHRTMKVDILRERVRNGSVKSIMFPEDVIENAAKIISDLRAVFPPQKNHYVLAPFFKIGYGTPTAVEVDLGILIEIPFKGRLILLGSLGIYLPHKDAGKRLGEIHVDIFGDLNFAASYVLIEGRLRDSHLTGVTLTGGFAFMLDWGSDPQFLLSVGGYHPRYKKPARFPEIPRITALIKKGDDIRLSCLYYQAITSNSYQIGFSAELLVKKGNARASGFLGFDALLQFDPFYFETDIKISVEVSYRGRAFFGIEMEFLLSGPEPWRAQGYAKIKVLFFSLKIKFNISWGGEQQAVPVFVSPRELLARLKLQLEQAGNWSGKLPGRYNQAESMRSLEEAEKQDQLFLHPSGHLELRQNLLPLDKTIEKLGSSNVEGRPTYKILDYRFGEGDPVDPKAQAPLQGYFSRGQFEDLPDTEKLSTPDFELMSAGIELSPARAFDIPQEMEFTANDFEDILLEATGSSRQETSFNWQGESLTNLGGRKAIDAARPEQLFGVMEELPEQKEKAYKILSKEALASPESLQEQYFSSYTGAKDYLQGHWPKEAQGVWQIVQAETEENEELVIG